MILFFSTLAFAADVPSLVFVGNSYIQNNNLHMVTTAMLGQHTIGWEGVENVALLGGGMALSDHADRVLDDSSSWFTVFHEPHTFFILQDQSQIPGFPQNTPYWQASISGLHSMQELIDIQEANTMLMLTWGRKDGDTQNSVQYPDFETMQDLLTEGYLSYSDQASTALSTIYIAPVGPVFAEIKTQSQSDFESLYSGDGSHPSQVGTATAAMSLFAALTGRQVEGIPTDLSTSQQLIISNAVHKVILEDVGDFPLPWIWTSAPVNGLIFDERYRPLLRLSTDHSGDLNVQDGRLWLEAGSLLGNVVVHDDSAFHIKGGSFTGDIEGDLYLEGGELNLRASNGNIWQSGGTLTVSSRIVEVSGEMVLGTVNLDSRLDEGYLHANNIDERNIEVANPALLWELVEASDGDTLHLYRGEDELPSENNERSVIHKDEKNDCAGTLPFTPLLLGLIAWKRRILYSKTTS